MAKTLQPTALRLTLGLRAIRTPTSQRSFSTTLRASAKNRIYPSPMRSEQELETLTLSSASTRIPLITMWSANWCQTCHAVRPLIHELLNSGVGEAEGGISFCEVEADSPDMGGMGGLSLRYGVNSLPTLLVFDRQEPQLETKVARLAELKDRAFLTKWIKTEAARQGAGGAGGSFWGLFGR